MSRTARKPRPWWQHATLPCTWTRWGRADHLGPLLDGTPPGLPVCMTRGARGGIVVHVPSGAWPWLTSIVEHTTDAQPMDSGMRLAARFGGWEGVRVVISLGGWAALVILWREVRGWDPVMRHLAEGP